MSFLIIDLAFSEFLPLSQRSKFELLPSFRSLANHHKYIEANNHSPCKSVVVNSRTPETNSALMI